MTTRTRRIVAHPACGMGRYARPRRTLAPLRAVSRWSVGMPSPRPPRHARRRDAVPWPARHARRRDAVARGAKLEIVPFKRNDRPRASNRRNGRPAEGIDLIGTEPGRPGGAGRGRPRMGRSTPLATEPNGSHCLRLGGGARRPFDSSTEIRPTPKPRIVNPRKRPRSRWSALVKPYSKSVLRGEDERRRRTPETNGGLGGVVRWAAG